MTMQDVYIWHNMLYGGLPSHQMAAFKSGWRHPS
jgi:hypothetical protein